jgi:hypothetical protein
MLTATLQLFHHDIAPCVVLVKSASGELPALSSAGGSGDTGAPCRT